MSIDVKYHGMYAFVKHTDLLQWFDRNYRYNDSSEFYQLRQRYATPRDVHLVLLYRFEGNKTYCKINCPINPLPVKGEFEVPTVSRVIEFLQQQKWQIEYRLPTHLLE